MASPTTSLPKAQSWPQVGLRVLGRAALLGRRPQQVADVEGELRQHQDRDQRRAGHEHDGLDDLHPGGALHAADRHVEHHQQADRSDGDRLARVALDAQQQGHQRARADHLGQQVEDRHDHGRDTRGSAHRALMHPERQRVGHRVLAGVAQQLGDQQQGDQPGDQEADGVQEPVVARQRDDAGDAEERRRRHVVTPDRDAVLDSGEAATAGVEVGGRLGVLAGPQGDRKGQHDERDEQQDGQRALTGGHGSAGGEELHAWASKRSRSRSAVGSRFFSACRE